MKKRLAAWLLAACAVLPSLARADDLCTGKFPNLITEVCWSCVFPIKMFGNVTLMSGGQEDYQSGPSQAACACTNGGVPKVGVPTSFWEMDMMTDVTTTPGCFPMLGGARVNIGVNSDAFGTDQKHRRNASASGKSSFRQVNLYLNPAMYVLGAVLDDQCLDNRGMDVPWVSFADPTHNDDELAGILTPYAFPFGSLLAIGANTADAVAATAGFPIKEIFWAAGAYGQMYPLTGNNNSHVSNEQSARLQTARVLAKLHAAGTQWSAAGEHAMCGYYPEIIMDKRQYKFQRLAPIPQTRKINGRCCDPIGRSTILAESGTQAPLPNMRDFSYAIFRKRDCCSGVTPGL
jgi:conjugal transfer pilus assembly protein TraU